MSFELKPFQRVQLRNGREGIVVDNPNATGLHSQYRLIFVFTDDGGCGFMPAAMIEEGGEEEWNVQQVWEHPDIYGDLLTFSRHGKMLWKEESAIVSEAKADVEIAKAILASAEARLQAALEADK